jgi:hypothetical protein
MFIKEGESLWICILSMLGVRYFSIITIINPSDALAWICQIGIAIATIYKFVQDGRLARIQRIKKEKEGQDTTQHKKND